MDQRGHRIHAQHSIPDISGLTHSRSKHKQTTFWRISSALFVKTGHGSNSAKATSTWINTDPGSISNKTVSTFGINTDPGSMTNQTHFGKYPVPPCTHRPRDSQHLWINTLQSIPNRTHSMDIRCPSLSKPHKRYFKIATHRNPDHSARRLDV